MMRGILGVAVGTTLLFAGSTGAAGAHSQTVQPPGHDQPVVQGPISRPWAQAHCNAASPAVLADHHVVRFSPAAALPCPPTPNPGGQIHP